ncbi:glycosyltransferase family 4 protein [Halomonas sp. QX-2]|uniref:Glycosyltransferase family 4 protein n=1 Tax=Vreelandella sedimenti TaxID=2729618 RepID=A0A7Z0SNZ8_9GAMM|nr:glycosyltransferase family 4 protein [Halomonas sedimenti]NYT74375.1 glycosyltransferase family 4 protein [Halomonas sedimenti]
MKLLAVSEHYYPRVGGTVNYVHETLCALAKSGVETELLVPGPADKHWLPEGMAEPPYAVHWLDAGYPAKGDPSREQRYDFCRQVDALAAERLAGPNRPDILHVLFGLFVMEVIDTKRLRLGGVACLATVHNVPPLECRQVAPNAPLPARIKEALRLQVVTLKNRGRLKKHDYDLYICPSQQVQELLTPVVGDQVGVIGHGPTTDLQALMVPPVTRRPVGPVRLLTVGGYAPHKCQHIIPNTAARLRDMNIDFIWEVAGPSGRVKGYRDRISRDLADLGLEGRVILHDAVPLADLGELYDRTHIYVQPSIEEGFCLTALDAAAVGLPVIGCRAGALPDIIKASNGIQVKSGPRPLAEAIAYFVKEECWQDANVQAAYIKAHFSWTRAAKSLLEHYDRLLFQKPSFYVAERI